jgi:hypothetical protein
MLTGFEIELNEIGGVTTQNASGETISQPANPDALKALFGD